MSDLDALQQTVGEWGTRTFPKSSPVSIALHLRDEANELVSEVPDGDEIAEEAADCLLLLLHLAHRCGFSLFDAAVAKATINERRTWQTEPNERGYMSHIEEGERP